MDNVISDDLKGHFFTALHFSFILLKKAAQFNRNLPKFHASAPRADRLKTISGLAAHLQQALQCVEKNCGGGAPKPSP